MKVNKKAEKSLTDYYDAARRYLIAKTEIEEEEQTDLKIKIATFVIYELSHTAPAWFKSHFLSDIPKNANKADIINNEKILKAENEFYNNIGEYLIKMEAEVDYVRDTLAPFKEEWDKKDFWKPIVFDAFLLAGIYFTLAPKFRKSDKSILGSKQIKEIINFRSLDNMLNFSSATP